MKTIFYTGTEWKGFEAPEKEYYMRPSPFAIMDGKTYLDKKGYNRDYAAARAAALPILNPEIGIMKSSKGEECMFDGYMSYGEVPYYKTIKEGEEYSWLGGWEVNEYCGAQKMIVLSLPNTVKPESNSSHGYSEGSDIDFNSPGNKVTPEEAKEREEGMNFIRGKESDIDLLGIEAAQIIQSLRDQLAAAIEDSMLVRQTVAKKINELAAKDEENRKLKEALKELLPYAEYNYEKDLLYFGELSSNPLKLKIDRAKSLLSEQSKTK